MTDARLSQQIQTREETLQSGVFYRHWAIDSPRAVVLLVHGLGEHSGRYQHVAEALAGRGLASFAPDHTGHGRSPGPRCHIDDFAQYFGPLDALREQAERDYPGVPCFLVGHSMGGLIVASYLLASLPGATAPRQQNFAGAAFSGAAFEVDNPPSATAIFINRLVAAVLPKLGVLQLDPSEVSRDAEVVRRYREDPLVHDGKVSARLVVELFRAMGTLAEARAQLSLPVLVMHGEGDVMTSPAGAQHFFDGVASADKTLRFYPGLYHEIFNEPEQAQVLTELGNWLDAHLPAV